MIKNRILRVLLCLILLLMSLPLEALADLEETDLAVANGCHSIDGAIPFLGQEKLIENTQSVFLFETGSETLMYAWNADMPVYPASLVKIMSALLVLEKGTLSDEVTVNQSALDAVSADAISADLQAGEVMTVENLMYCMMVSAANDAAAVLAEYVSGAQESFVALMNNRAAELGCTGTNFTNPHGLHNDLQVSTARDICRILQAALDFDEFRTIFGTVRYTVPATNLHVERSLSTNNYLMNTDSVAIHYDSRVTGGRTGLTSDGYRCVASVSESGNMELICIVMGAASTYTDRGYVKSYGGFPETSELLDMAYSGYSKKQIIYENQILRQQSVLNGDSDVFAASYEAFSTVLPSDISFDELSFQYADAPGSTQAPIKKGQNLAALQVWYGSLCIAQTDVYAMNDVPVAYVKKVEISEDTAGGNGWILIAVIVIIVLIAAIFFILPRFLRAKKNRNQRHHKNTRRRH